MTYPQAGISFQTTDIQAAIAHVKSDSNAFTDFSSRADAIDFLDFHVIQRIEDIVYEHDRPYPKLELLKQEALYLKQELEILNEDLFRQFREKIRSGENFLQTIQALAALSTSFYPSDNNEGYDNLDLLVNGIISGPPLPYQTIDLETDMVFYQKTPARVTFEMAARSGLKADDVFVDIGSGLGQVCILVKLLADATVIGVEFEPAFCTYARQCAEGLMLSGISFQNCDARMADFSTGTVFFMYTPFTGNIMLEVLGRLQTESQKRPITILTYGPCTAVVAAQSWLALQSDKQTGTDATHLFKSICT